MSPPARRSGCLRWARRVAPWLLAAGLVALTGPLWLAALAGTGPAWRHIASVAGRTAGWLLLLPVAVFLPARAHSLENENRHRILEFLEAHPGASIQQVRAHLDVAWGTTVYHLDRLRRDGLVVGHRHGNHHRYWLSNTPEARLRRGWSVLEQATARDIALAVASTPGMHQSAICDALDVRAPSASKHLSRLERHGLVAKRRVSRFAVYEATDVLHELLQMRSGRPALDAGAPATAHAVAGGADAASDPPPSDADSPAPGDLVRR